MKKFFDLTLRAVVMLSLLLSSSGCIDDSIDKAITALQDSMTAIQAQSDAWRAELPKLENTLQGLESSASGDAKTVISDTTNNVHDLSQESIAFVNSNATDVIAKAGVEFRCNSDFVRTGITSQIQYMIDDLKFWKGNKKHLDKKPNHTVCQVNPNTLTLIPSGNSWAIDSSTLITANVVAVFGYNFRQDAMPRLVLQDSNGNPVRDVNLKPAYVTTYQLNLDFSTENFANVSAGSRVVLNWPDIPDPNTLTLVMLKPAALALSNPSATPASPIMLKDQVTYNVNITNNGDVESGTFVIWVKPDPNDARTISASQPAIKPHASRSVPLTPFMYNNSGSITALFYIQGVSTVQLPVNVQSNIAGISTCNINNPIVNQRWTRYPASTVPQCNLLPGDKVEIINAGGCVQTGGAGRTWKRYVNPDPSDSYYGMIAIPGILGEEKGTSLKSFINDLKYVTIPQGLNPVLELGYMDNNYGDNGYWGHDDGTNDQCKNVGNAFVSLRITHYR